MAPPQITRRRLLGLMATTGIVAGCVGSGDGHPGEDQGLGAAHAEPDGLHTFVGPLRAPTIHDIQFNRWNQDNRVHAAENVLFVPGVEYNPANQSFERRLIESWELVEDSTISVELAPGYRWQDDEGREVGAVDLVAQERIRELQADTLIYELDEIYADDGRTVNYEFDEPVNPRIVAHYYFTAPIWLQSDRYESVLETLDVVRGDEDGENELRREIADFEQPEPVGNSTWTFDEAASDRLAFTVDEDHPEAETLAFTEYWLISNPRIERALMSIGGDEQDLIILPQDASLDEFTDPFIPDNVSQHSQVPFRGRMIAFNYSHEPFDDPLVRRAIQAIIDVGDLADSRSEWGVVPARYPVGIAGHAIDLPQQVLGDQRNGFPEPGPDHDRAEQLLEMAGFERDEEGWRSATGDLFQMHLVWTRDEQIRTLLEDQLRQFGIAVNSERKVNAPEAYSDALKSGKFDVIEVNWGWRVPFEGYRHIWGTESPWREYAFDWSTEVTVPAPFDGEGEQTFDVLDVLADIHADPDADGFDDHLQRLAWIFAHDVPFIPLFEFSISAVFNTNTVNVVEWAPGTPVLEQIRKGHITPADA